MEGKTKPPEIGLPGTKEGDSILTFSIRRAIELHPDQAAREMVRLMRHNAELETKLYLLKETVRCA